MEKVKKMLGKLDATTVEEGREKQPHVVSGPKVTDLFEGGCTGAHLIKFRNAVECHTCDRQMTLINSFANYTCTTCKGRRKYEVVKDVDARIARVRGENFKNIATVKGYVDADDEIVRQVHICIDCAEKIEYLPQAFADGKLIKHDAAEFDDCPKIYHKVNDDGEEVPNRKWKTMARDSIAPPNGTEREKHVQHIMESLARKMKKDGMVNLKTVEEMMAEFNEEEEKMTVAAMDWVCQIVPGTGKEKGACLLYAHRCDMERVEQFQSKKVMNERNQETRQERQDDRSAAQALFVLDDHRRPLR